MSAEQPRQRASDPWFYPFIAFWDWIDKRKIALHAVLFVTLWLTWDVIRWAINFGWYSSRPGIEVAAIIGAVLTPWGGMQGAMFLFYANAIKSNGQTK